MMIKDPQNLLPVHIQDSGDGSGLVLDVPPHGIPLHRKSIERLFAAIKSGERAIAFKPTVPILSELGLAPSYPTLAYLYPQELIHHRDDRKQPALGHARNSQNTAGSTRFTSMSQVDEEEQLHYFVEHYGMAVKPSSVRVIVSNTCNLKCIMCPYHSPSLKFDHTTDFFKSKKIMSWEMMERLAKDCGAIRAMIVIGNIEEPMLHPQIIEFVQQCRQQGVPAVHMTTNGQLLDENRARALLEAGLTSIDISIDAADSETYLKVRGADLKRVETNVLNFLRVRDQLGSPCSVRTSFVRNQTVNPDEEQRFRERWLTRADGVFINNVAHYQGTNTRLHQTNQPGHALLQRCLQSAKGRWPCLFPFTELAVLPDGSIYYCVETLFRLGFDPHIQSMGDYRNQSLQAIWAGEPFKQLRRDLILNQLDNQSACKNCELWKAQVMSRSSQDGLDVITTTVTEIYQRASIDSTIS